MDVQYYLNNFNIEMNHWNFPRDSSKIVSFMNWKVIGTSRESEAEKDARLKEEVKWTGL